jgi:hypothetical protein
LPISVTIARRSPAASRFGKYAFSALKLGLAPRRSAAGEPRNLLKPTLIEQYVIGRKVPEAGVGLL